MPRGVYDRKTAKPRKSATRRGPYKQAADVKSSRSNVTKLVTKRSKRLPHTETPQRELFYRYSEDSETYRVWRADWFGDQFEVISTGQFEQLKYWCTRFSLPLMAAPDDE